MKKHEKLAIRLSEIIHRLHQGERLDLNKLSEYYKVSNRTLQRDFKDRLSFLSFYEQGPRYYQLDKQSKLFLSNEDIARFARFASIQELFPEIDRTFYQEQLISSVQVKGYHYQDSSRFKKEFEILKTAIEGHKQILFSYLKNNESTPKDYQLSPYCLVNKNGIWYLMGEQENQLKTFCVSQIKMIHILEESFKPNPQTQKIISSSDSIYHGNQTKEIIIKANQTAAPYFKRRQLLPNQEIVRELDDGGLLILCHDVHEMEVVPIVQYWIPHLTIISPNGLQEKMEQSLRNYLNHSSNLLEIVYE